MQLFCFLLPSLSGSTDDYVAFLLIYLLPRLSSSTDEDVAFLLVICYHVDPAAQVYMKLF